MDLRSMLNESAAPKQQARPPPSQQSPVGQSYQPQPAYFENQSIDASSNTYAASRERPPQPPPLRTSDPRSPGNPSSTYSSIQSPYQHTSASTSTLSGGAGSYHGQSPGQGGQSHPHVAREAHATQQPPYHQQPPAQSPYGPPSTPNGPPPYLLHQRSQSSHSMTAQSPATFPQPYPPRESPSSISGQPHPQAHHFSPQVQHQSQPATPLGPPGPYHGPPSYRPPSSGYDHSRTYSTGSYGSQPGADFHQRPLTSPQQSIDGLHRQTSYEQDRERSQSVSPKTIIHPGLSRPPSSLSPSQTRQLTPSQNLRHGTPQEQSRPEVPTTYRQDGVNEKRASISASATPSFQHPSTSRPSSTHQSPAPVSNNTPTPKASITGASIHNTPKTSNMSLKRDFGSMGPSSHSPQPPPRKRLRHDEIPRWAQNARNGRPVNFRRVPGPQMVHSQPRPLQSVPVLVPAVNGQIPPNGVYPDAVSAAEYVPPTRWEPSIINSATFDDLTRVLCDMIFHQIGGEPPSEGAKFEIEAKLGEIQSRDEHARLRFPVMSETLLQTDNLSLPNTRFESSMDIAQYSHLNDYLNKLANEAEAPDRLHFDYQHTREADTFYELTADGQANLPPSIRRFLNPRHKPKVRVTRDMKTDTVTAKIIKSRLADFDIYNPRQAFDYRISISVESPWDGPDGWVYAVNESDGRRGSRLKDRLSYRHCACQIDLTQVSYSSSARKDHELEIEIAPDLLRHQIAAAREQKPHDYEKLVRSFVDNVRILARQFPSQQR